MSSPPSSGVRKPNPSRCACTIPVTRSRWRTRQYSRLRLSSNWPSRTIARMRVSSARRCCSGAMLEPRRDRLEGQRPAGLLHRRENLVAARDLVLVAAFLLVASRGSRGGRVMAGGSYCLGAILVGFESRAHLIRARFDTPGAGQYIRAPSPRCPGGGIGRRAGFRCQWSRYSWRFKSSPGHQIYDPRRCSFSRARRRRGHPDDRHFADVVVHDVARRPEARRGSCGRRPSRDPWRPAPLFGAARNDSRDRGSLLLGQGALALLEFAQLRRQNVRFANGDNRIGQVRNLFIEGGDLAPTSVGGPPFRASA